MILLQTLNGDCSWKEKVKLIQAIEHYKKYGGERYGYWLSLDEISAIDPEK